MSAFVSVDHSKNAAPFTLPPHRPYTIRRPLIPNSLHSSSGNEGERSLLLHLTMIYFIWNFIFSPINQHLLYLLQQRSSTAGWKVSGRFTCRWMSERNAVVAPCVVSSLCLCLSQVSVSRRGLSTASSLASIPASTYTWAPDTSWRVRHAKTRPNPHWLIQSFIHPPLFVWNEK